VNGGVAVVMSSVSSYTAIKFYDASDTNDIKYANIAITKVLHNIPNCPGI